MARSAKGAAEGTPPVQGAPDRLRAGDVPDVGGLETVETLQAVAIDRCPRRDMLHDGREHRRLFEVRDHGHADPPRPITASFHGVVARIVTGSRDAQDAAHDLPDEVPEARQKQPESGPTQLVNDQLTSNKRPVSDGAARAHVRQRCCTNRSSCNNAPQPPRVVEPERPTPLPNRLIRHRDTPFGEEILDISKAKTEPIVEPDSVTDNFRGKPVSAIAGRWVRHRRTLPAVVSI